MFSGDTSIKNNQQYTLASEELFNRFSNRLLKINKIDGNLI
jgi:hypothetical protein